MSPEPQNLRMISPHRLEIRVYYEDTDAAGIVYHANYLKFAERARTEMLRAAGLDHPGLLAGAGGQFTVARATLAFTAPARLDDLLEVTSEVEAATGARLRLTQSVRRDGLELCRMQIELAFVGPDLRPRRLPSGLRAPPAASSRRC